MVSNVLALGRCVPLISSRVISSRWLIMDMPIGLLSVNGTVNVYDSLHECQLICAMAMSEDRLVKKVYMDEARGRRPRRWPGKRWQDTILN